MRKIFLCMSVILLQHSITSKAQTISTVAGCGTGCPLGDGGPATMAQLSTPGEVGFDSWGNVYIASPNRVRKVNATTGIITTYAGNGSFGFMGDGGPATAARITSGWFVFDTADNLYFADGANRRIRKVDAATGIINTIAGNGIAHYAGDGGPASAASFYTLGAIAIDVAGNLYVGDSNRIRRIDAITGTITHYAGSGVLGYSGDGGPATAANIGAGGLGGGMCCDAFGNLYMCSANQRIRKITASGIISTFAGNGTTIYAGDGAAATATGFGQTDVALDVAGNLYICDYGNHRVLMVNAAGNIHTVAGIGIAGYSGDGGPATVAQLNRPQAIAIGRCDGNLYVSENVNQRVRKIAFTSLPPSCTCTPVSIATIAPNDTICAGDTVTLYATIASGGVSHTYQWYVNGSPVSGATSNIYGYTPANGDSARCVITTSGGICSAPATTSSNTINIVAGAPPVAIGLAGLTVAETGDTVTVTATVTTTAGYYINWYRNGVLFITTSVPVTTFVKSGANDTITATAVTIPTEDMPCLDSAASALHVVSFPTGVRQFPLQTSVQYALYPNPVKNTLTISATAAIGSVTITNMVGQSFDVPIIKEHRQAEIDVAKLAVGMYMVRVNDVWVQRFVKE